MGNAVKRKEEKAETNDEEGERAEKKKKEKRRRRRKKREKKLKTNAGEKDKETPQVHVLQKSLSWMLTFKE